MRNKIRHHLTPKLLEIFPNFLNQFQESLSYLNSANQFFQEEIQKTFEEILISGDEKEFVLDKEKLLKKHKTIIVEIIRKLGFTGIEIEKVIFSENGKFFRSNSHEISIKRKEIYCKKKHEKDE